MKILFYDGDIRWWSHPTSFDHYNTVNASGGYTNNKKSLKHI